VLRIGIVRIWQLRCFGVVYSKTSLPNIAFTKLTTQTFAIKAEVSIPQSRLALIISERMRD
jgi:hypothetical protein